MTNILDKYENDLKISKIICCADSTTGFVTGFRYSLEPSIYDYDGDEFERFGTNGARLPKSDGRNAQSFC